MPIFSLLIYQYHVPSHLPAPPWKPSTNNIIRCLSLDTWLYGFFLMLKFQVFKQNSDFQAFEIKVDWSRITLTGNCESTFNSWMHKIMYFHNLVWWCPEFLDKSVHEWNMWEVPFLGIFIIDCTPQCAIFTILASQPRLWCCPCILGQQFRTCIGPALMMYSDFQFLHNFLQ